MMAKLVTVYSVGYDTGRIKQLTSRIGEPERVYEEYATRAAAQAVATIALNARVNPLQMTYANARRAGWIK